MDEQTEKQIRNGSCKNLKEKKKKNSHSLFANIHMPRIVLHLGV